MEVGGEAIRPQNRSNPGVGERKARSTVVGQQSRNPTARDIPGCRRPDRLARRRAPLAGPRPKGTRNRPQAASLPHAKTVAAREEFDG
jgi:hypothetical protein